MGSSWKRPCEAPSLEISGGSSLAVFSSIQGNGIQIAKVTDLLGGEMWILVWVRVLRQSQTRKVLWRLLSRLVLGLDFAS